MNDIADWGWLAVVVGGPVVLGAAVLYGRLASRRRSRGSILQSESATRELYREIDKDA